MQQNNIREQLVNVGLWNADDPRDPSKSEEAAQELKTRCEETFRCDLRQSGYSGDAIDSHYWIKMAPEYELLAKASNFPMAMCEAAIELHNRFGSSAIAH